MKLSSSKKFLAVLAVCLLVFSFIAYRLLAPLLHSEQRAEYLRSPSALSSSVLIMKRLARNVPLHFPRRPRSFLEEFVSRGLLYTYIDADFSERFHLPIKEGMLVYPCKEAAQLVGGLQDHISPKGVWFEPWDIAVKCNGEPVSERALVSAFESSRSVDMEILRDGKFIRETLHGYGKKNALPKYAADEFVQVLYFPDVNQFQGSPVTLKSGKGHIRGKAMIAGMPAMGLTVSLLLSSNKRSQPAEVDADGSFDVRVPPGDYLYLGYALSKPPLPKLIPIDRRMAKSLFAKEDNIERLNELSDKLGPGNAWKMFMKEEREKSKMNERYELNVTSSSAASIPDIIFAEPVHIVAPIDKTTVSRNQLRFVWIPHPGASYYYVDISYISKEEDGSQSIYPVAGNKVTKNVLNVEETSPYSRPWFPSRGAHFASGACYGVKVYAYSQDDTLLSASSPNYPVEFWIK